jgi:uncharacterized repeat protein (TIGR03803 family)
MSRAFGKFVAAVSLTTVAFAICASPAAVQRKKSDFNVLYTFTGSGGGANSFAGLVQDANGNFYGTTIAGGSGTVGTVFKLAPNGTETVLYNFTDGTDGGGPYGKLVLDQQGNLYGTTYAGGFHTCNCGVAFKIDPSGQETVLHTFLGGDDGATPYSGLAFDKKGNLYGITNAGGGACNCGTVFKLAPDGTATILHDFAGGSDGAFPFYNSDLTVDKLGNLYGVTYQGGGSCNCGTIYKVDTSGKESILYAFADGSDGAYPVTNLLADKSGNFYGTTRYGGSGNAGTVFKLAPDNTKTVLYSFAGSGDGGAPQAGVVADKLGNLYGTTELGGGNDAGVVFRVAPDGGETVLHSFSGGADGNEPYGALFAGKKKELYGTSTSGGTNGLGTVFEVSAKD